MPPRTPSLEHESLQVQQQFNAAGVAQVIVVLKTPTAAAAGPSSGAARRLRKHFVSSELSVDSAIQAAASSTGSRRRMAAAPPPHPKVPPVRVYPNLGVMLGTVTPQGLVHLRKESDVAAVAGAPVLTLIKPRRTAEAALQRNASWGIGALAVPQLWRQGFTGKGVIVAHLDTGADGRHPALRNAFADFAEFDLLGNLKTAVRRPHDTGEHGTHTAITVAGRPVRGVNLGVAPDAKLASAIVIEGGNVVARVLAGLDWALGRGARVLSMSLGLPGFWRDFLTIVQILRTRGVLPVIAVGNEGPGTSRSPGNYAEALSVGAVDEDLVVADFSSSQRFSRRQDPVCPDLVGPGVDIISGVPGNRYKAMSGTSMATPHIAGLAALLFQAKPTATVDEVEEAILKSCQLAPGMTADRVGRGMPNGPRALALLLGTVSKGRGLRKGATRSAAVRRARPRRRPASRRRKSARRRLAS